MRNRPAQESLFENGAPTTLADAATGALDAPKGTRVSPVYETYWRFAAERQAIFMRRARGQIAPFTSDLVLASYKFTNAYRASDRTSQALIDRAIERDDLPDDPREVFFRVMLFKLFNKIETWDLLEREIGPITLAGYRYEHYDEVLGKARRMGTPIYSSAYIMPSARERFGHHEKHRNHLRLIELMVAEQVPEHIAQTKSATEAFNRVRACPSLGDFLAYQLITDIGYSKLGDYAEDEFVTPGPGARDGIAKCFIDTGGRSESDLIKMLADEQEQAFEKLGLTFETLAGRALQLIDCQNLLCETDKYARVAHPEVQGRSGRTKIKHRFKSHRERLRLRYPKKWNITIGPDGAPTKGRCNKGQGRWEETGKIMVEAQHASGEGRERAGVATLDVQEADNGTGRKTTEKHRRSETGESARRRAMRRLIDKPSRRTINVDHKAGHR